MIVVSDFLHCMWLAKIFYSRLIFRIWFKVPINSKTAVNLPSQSNFTPLILIYPLFQCSPTFIVAFRVELLENIEIKRSVSLKLVKNFFSSKVLFHLILSWRRSLSYRNQFIGLQSKSVEWFQYDRGFRHERVKPIHFHWQYHYNLMSKKCHEDHHNIF